MSILTRLFGALLTITVFLVALPGYSAGAPASEVPNVYDQPDGKSFVGIRFGDEFFSWDVSVDVYPVVKGSDGNPSFSSKEGDDLINLQKSLTPDNPPESSAKLGDFQTEMTAFKDETNRKYLGTVTSGGAEWVVIQVGKLALAYAPNYAGNPVIMMDDKGFWCFAEMKDGQLIPGPHKVGQDRVPLNTPLLGGIREYAKMRNLKMRQERFPDLRQLEEKCPTCPQD